MTSKEALLQLICLLLGSHSGQEPCAAIAAHWDTLMPVLAMGYGATLSRADQSMLRLIRTLSAQQPGWVTCAMDEGDAWGDMGMIGGITGMG